LFYAALHLRDTSVQSHQFMRVLPHVGSLAGVRPHSID
jgi:hypothetical protein